MLYNFLRLLISTNPVCHMTTCKAKVIKYINIRMPDGGVKAWTEERPGKGMDCAG